MVHKNREKVHYVFVLVGAILVVAYVAMTYKHKIFIGAIGFVLLMLGLYNISRTIKDKPMGKDTFVVSEELDEEPNKEEDELEDRR